jgi:hypothetical protein
MSEKRRSSNITEGVARAPNRSMYYAMGYVKSDFDKPMIGIANGHSTITPCNSGLQTLADAAVEAVRTAGGNPQTFGTPTISDGMSMGTEGMKYSLVSRDFGKLRQVLATVTPGLVYAATPEYAAAIAAAVGADVPVVLGEGSLPGRATIAWAELPAATPGPRQAAAEQAAGPDTIVKFLFTSGSTKAPKAVTTTHRMICSNLQMIRQCFGFLAEEPQLPTTTVVTPMRTKFSASGSSATSSAWVWTSMKPGATNNPLASITRAASPPGRPSATIRPSFTATSANCAGLPAPSSTRPPRISTSKSAAQMRPARK